MQRYWDWKAFGDEFALRRSESFKVWYWWRVIHAAYGKWESEKHEEAGDEDDSSDSKGGGKKVASKKGGSRKTPKLPSKRSKG